MRISKLSERAGLPVGTVKFYLRSGLLHPGRATSATQALYDETHLARLHMIRALFEVGGLSLAQIQRILNAIAPPTDGADDAWSLVDRALTGPTSDEAVVPDVNAARALLRKLGWHVAADSPNLVPLSRALAALDSVGVEVDHEHLLSYAEAAVNVARHDLSAVEKVASPDRPATVAASAVLFDPVFSSLRRLAHEHQNLRERARIPARVAVPNA